MTDKFGVKRIAQSLVALATATFAILATPLAAAGAAPSASYVLGQNGSFTTAVGATTATGMNGPRATAVDTVRHRLFAIDGNRVLVFNLNADNSISDATADYVLGEGSFTDNTNWSGQNGFNSPTGLAYDSNADRLYVADPVNARVMVFDTSTITNFMNASVVLGQADFGSSPTYSCSANRMDAASAVAVDPAARRLYVADTNHSRVLVFDTGTLSNGMNASYVIGQPDLVSCGQAATQTNMKNPKGVAVDTSRNLLIVADPQYNRVTVYPIATLSNGIAASYVIGQTNFTNVFTATTSTGLSGPWGVSVAGSTLLVTDNGNNRVLRYDMASLATGMAASSVYGQNDFVSNASGTTASTFSAVQQATVDSNGLYIYVSDFSNKRVLVFIVNQAQIDVTATVAPIFAFTVAGSSSACNGVTPTGASSATGVNLRVTSSATPVAGAQVFTVGTNSNNGFAVFQQGSTPSGSRALTAVTGTNASPAAFGSGERFGYSLNDTNVAGFAGPLWAAVSSSRATVMSRTTGFASVSNCVVYQVATAANTPAGTYASTITYTAVPAF